MKTYWRKFGDLGHPNNAPATVPIKNARKVQTDNSPKVHTTESPIKEFTDLGSLELNEENNSYEY